MDIKAVPPYSHDPLHFRPCVGAWILDDRRRLLVAMRLDNPGPYWQAVQGGIDPGENPTEALNRELWEEAGLGSDSVTIESISSCWYAYRLPGNLRSTLWNGRYIGQQQLWFLLSPRRPITSLSLATHNLPEFMAWKWVLAKNVLDVVIPFKRKVYRNLLREWKSHLE